MDIQIKDYLMRLYAITSRIPREQKYSHAQIVAKIVKFDPETVDEVGIDSFNELMKSLENKY
jgi:hypothetical protein